jgi:hypothetical protein
MDPEKPVHDIAMESQKRFDMVTVQVAAYQPSTDVENQFEFPERMNDGGAVRRPMQTRYHYWDFAVDDSSQGLELHEEEAAPGVKASRGRIRLGSKLPTSLVVTFFSPKDYKVLQKLLSQFCAQTALNFLLFCRLIVAIDILCVVMTQDNYIDDVMMEEKKGSRTVMDYRGRGCERRPEHGMETAGNASPG